MKLGIVVARNKNILFQNDFHSSPGKHVGDWNWFLTRHIQTLWACDFFAQDVWTAFGKVTFYAFFFIHLSHTASSSPGLPATRRVRRRSHSAGTPWSGLPTGVSRSLT